MRIAVTGAGGFLGRALVPVLARDPAVSEVVAIDNRVAAGSPIPGVRRVQRDVRDPGILEEFRGCDALAHLAFRVLGRGSDAESVNVGGSRNVFGAALTAGVSGIVHASSAAAYGCSADNPVPISESRPLRAFPDFYYPRTKVAVEAMLERLEASNPGLRVVRLRPVGTLGPGAPELAGGHLFISLSDHDPLMQFTWIDDVVAAFRLTLLDPGAHGAFNVGAPDPVRASEVAELIGVRRVRLPRRVLRSVAGAGAALRLPGAMDPGWIEMARYPIVVDASRAQRELGWKPSCDCTEVLRRYARVRTAERQAATPMTSPVSAATGGRKP